MTALSNLIDDLREIRDQDQRHALADSIRAVVREIGFSRDRIATASACSEACHELGRLILEVEIAGNVKCVERFLAQTGDPK